MTTTMNRAPGASGQASAENDWLVCAKCRSLLYRNRFERLAQVCYECGWHAPLTARDRLGQLLDAGSAKLVEPGPSVHDPLGFTDLVPYRERLMKAQRATGLDDAVQVVRGAVRGNRVVTAVMDFRFLGGSLGTAAGEAVATAAETALAHRVPLVLVTASGGARMQEGVLSLMQMAKTSNAMAALDEAGLLTVTLVTDPTFGGVAASFATLSDVIVAESGARMGFAGPRVIEQTVRQRLPDGFQSAEFLLKHGLVDDVRSRTELPQVLAVLLGATRSACPDWGRGETDPVVRDPGLLERKDIERVIELARHPDRPTTLDHGATWFDGFLELHGDRAGADCPAIVGGLANLDGLPTIVIGHQKGHTTGESIRRNFGMPAPAGYRKAVRLMRLAAKLRVPVVALIDTPGAYPGMDAERHGQANAISECLRVMGGLPVPVVSVITGEGGSGGALALAVADRVLLCENAIYSVISPEGCAAILWRSPQAAAKAAAALRLDSRSLLEFGVIDGVIPEPRGGAHRDPARASLLVRDAVRCALRELRGRDGEELVASRRERFRRLGLVETTMETEVEAR
ncbi:acetyl-CoA carboxylase carboxyl transferase subunit beta [Kibdelosporangium banguiense]|uniref:Multifunctional fusion protein n=1 Tax=Kibdelosporangium banguiense TaxID=1365924 RepID=A0ABS4TT37_9PSEU|nr:acetyl-CoA carboxylase carboxyltransferase subunit alpha [Kibdelosporangium banguiense]MBP2327562.1 acetyl-CoA carboxylase carboxyl transferase subunit beta [Kibdelosporangium banguiense]